MSRRKLGEEQIRNLQKSGRSYFVRLPINIVRKLEWQERQKLVVTEKDGRITIKDWEK